MQHIYKTTNKQLRKAMFTVFGGKCFYSGQPVAENEFEIDHVIPKSKGGQNSVYNYVLTSKELNRKKRDKIDKEAVIKILYIIKTVYAPKVIKILSSAYPYNAIPLCDVSTIHIPMENLAKLKGISGTAYYVYGLFRSKIEYKENTDKIIVLSNIVTFPYAEANRFGVDSKVFSKAINVLVSISLIEVMLRGTYGGRKPTYYKVY